MLNFLKKNQPKDELGLAVLETLSELQVISKALQFELENNDVRWDDNKIQTFIPLILNYTNFEWLDLIAKKERNENYIIIKDFLDHVEHLMKNGSETLLKEMRGTYEL